MRAMAEVPAGERGMSRAAWLVRYVDQHIAEWKRQAPRAQSPPEPKIATSRDNYGWRSLPSGTRYLGR